MTSREYAAKIVNAVRENDLIGAKNLFNDAVKSLVGLKINDRKMEIGQEVLLSPEEENSDPYEAEVEDVAAVS